MSEHSWRLKIARAEKHLFDLQELTQGYIDGHFYRAECPQPPQKKPTHWRFVLKITQPPDPIIAVVLGDMLFNLRSALDHIAVALAPPERKANAEFPIYGEPIFDQDPVTGEWVIAGDKQREKFESMTRGMPIQAQAIIEREQPYNLRGRHSGGRSDATDALWGLRVIQNADKHRTLAVLVSGITMPHVTVTGGGESFGTLTPKYIEPGAELISWRHFGNRIPYSEVQVKVKGTLAVAVQVGDKGPYHLDDVTRGSLQRVRRIIDSLEPFVRF